MLIASQKRSTAVCFKNQISFTWCSGDSCFSMESISVMCKEYIYIHEVIHIFQIDVFMLGMLNPKYNMPKRKHMNLENIYITLCTCIYIYIVHVFQYICVWICFNLNGFETVRLRTTMLKKQPNLHTTKLAQCYQGLRNMLS